MCGAVFETRGKFPAKAFSQLFASFWQQTCLSSEHALELFMNWASQELVTVQAGGALNLAG